MQAQIFAITIENKGGSKTPILSILQVIGNVIRTTKLYFVRIEVHVSVLAPSFT